MKRFLTSMSSSWLRIDPGEVIPLDVTNPQRVQIQVRTTGRCAVIATETEVIPGEDEEAEPTILTKSVLVGSVNDGEIEIDIAVSKDTVLEFQAAKSTVVYVLNRARQQLTKVAAPSIATLDMRPPPTEMERMMAMITANEDRRERLLNATLRSLQEKAGQAATRQGRFSRERFTGNQPPAAGQETDNQEEEEVISDDTNTND